LRLVIDASAKLAHPGAQLPIDGKAGWEACATSGKLLDVRRGTGILPVGLYQAAGHGQVAHATRATVNREARPSSGAPGYFRGKPVGSTHGVVSQRLAFP
jgi:hypothetical protein